MASLRTQRIAAGVQQSSAALRVQRVAAGVQVTTAVPALRVQRVAAGVEYLPVTFPVTAAASVTTAAPAGTPVTLSGAATPPSGESVVSWLWSPLSSDAPLLSSRTAQNPTLRLNPQLTARSLSWSLLVTTTSGAQSSAVVSVPVRAAQYRTIGLDGVVRPFAWIGRIPAGGGGTPPTPVKKLRVARVVAGIVAPADEPPPSEVTMLTGGVCRYDRSNSLTADFATGESDFGTLQCTKHYFSGGNLPATYSSPFPSRVLVLLSWAKDTNFRWDTNPQQWISYIQSIPTGTIVTFQHEPERPGLFPSGEDYVDRFNAVRAKVREVRTDLPMWHFCSGYNYNPNRPGYDGSYLSGTRAAGGTYRITADGFGYDGYRGGDNDNVNGDKVIDIQDRDEWKRWKSLIFPGKPWGISETGFGEIEFPNNPSREPIVQAQRNATVPTSHAWLRTHGCSFFIYFFSDLGPDGGTHRPKDAEFKTMYQGLPRGA